MAAETIPMKPLRALTGVPEATIGEEGSNDFWWTDRAVTWGLTDTGHYMGAPVTPANAPDMFVLRSVGGTDEWVEVLTGLTQPYWSFPDREFGSVRTGLWLMDTQIL